MLTAHSDSSFWYTWQQVELSRKAWTVRFCWPLNSCSRQFPSQTFWCDVQHWAGVEALCFGSTPGTLFTGSRDCSVKAWRQQERDGRWAFAADFEAHTGWVTALVAFPDLLASASYDTTIRLWRPSASVRFLSSGAVLACP